MFMYLSVPCCFSGSLHIDLTLLTRRECSHLTHISKPSVVPGNRQFWVGNCNPEEEQTHTGASEGMLPLLFYCRAECNGFQATEAIVKFSL